MENISGKLTIEQWKNMMAMRNFAGELPFTVAKSTKMKKLLRFIGTNDGFYSLTSSPHIITMYLNNEERGRSAKSKKAVDDEVEAVRCAVEGLEKANSDECLNPTRDVMLAKVKSGFTNTPSALVVIIMAHGGSGQLLAAKDEKTKDKREQVVKIDDLLTNMDTPELKGRPKVNIRVNPITLNFYVHACTAYHVMLTLMLLIHKTDV